MNVQQLISALGGQGSAAAQYAANAAGVLGTSKLAILFDHFQTGSLLPPSWVAINSGTGSTAMAIGSAETSGQGYLQCSSGATAASVGGGALGSNVVMPQARAWYMATRFRLTTVPDANTITGFYNADVATSRTIGPFAFPAVKAANFCVQHSGALTGSAIDLGVAFDTAYHVFEWWGPGTTALSARIDGGPILSATMSAMATGVGQVAVAARNGATAANQSLIVDWYLAAGAE